MFSDFEKRERIRKLRSASLVESVFENSSTKIHPLDPTVDIDIQSPDSSESRKYQNQTKLSSIYQNRFNKNGPIKFLPQRRLIKLLINNKFLQYILKQHLNFPT